MIDLSFEKLVDFVLPALGKHDTQLRKAIPPLRNNKILDKFIEIIHVCFFALQSPVNAFISSFYFYVNIENMPTRIISLNISFSVVKNM